MCMILLLHIKQNKRKLTNTCHLHKMIIGSGCTSYERMLESDDASKSMYVYDVKTQKLQVRGTPCKCCNRSQERYSPGLRLRLTPLLVFTERVY